MDDLILSIDTATDRIGLSLSTRSEILAESVWQTDRYHTVELAPRAAVMMLETATEPGDLDRIAVAAGPGSYTGLRIGMAFAKGLSLAHGIPLHGIPTLDGLARMQPEREGRLVAVLQAGRGRIAAVWYKWGRSGWEVLKPPTATTWDEFALAIDEPVYVCGEIEAEARQMLRKNTLIELASPALSLRRPSFLAEIARERKLDQLRDNPATVAPTYLGEV